MYTNMYEYIDVRMYASADRAHALGEATSCSYVYQHMYVYICMYTYVCIHLYNYIEVYFYTHVHIGTPTLDEGVATSCAYVYKHYMHTLYICIYMYT